MMVVRVWSRRPSLVQFSNNQDVLIRKKCFPGNFSTLPIHNCNVCVGYVRSGVVTVRKGKMVAR